MGESQLSEPTLALAAGAGPGVTDPCPVRRSSVLYFTLRGSDSGWGGASPSIALPCQATFPPGPLPHSDTPLASPLDPFPAREPQVVLTEALRRPLECTISPSGGTDEPNRSGTLLLSKVMSSLLRFFRLCAVDPNRGQISTSQK